MFVGIGLPQPPRSSRPWIYSSGHLERAPGWIAVFREPQSAVYLRANARNRANLARVEDYYARAEVPFDAAIGFDAAAVIRSAPASRYSGQVATSSGWIATVRSISRGARPSLAHHSSSTADFAA